MDLAEQVYIQGSQTSQTICKQNKKHTYSDKGKGCTYFD